MKNRLLVIIVATFYTFTIHAQDSLLYKKKNFIKDNDTLLYRIMYPRNFSKEKKYPIVLFLHGAGERGNDNKKQLVHGSKLFANEVVRDSFPAIVVFPQCPVNDYWANVDVDRTTFPLGLQFHYQNEPTKSMQLVINLLDQFLAKSFVKKDQVYVMGLSMGGMGTFEILYRRPNVFAAAVPICGAGETNSAKSYATKIPLWVFHGAQDNVVDPQFSIDMVSAILKDGGYPRFTLFDFANHNSWDAAFAEPELLLWLYSHKKGISE